MSWDDGYEYSNGANGSCQECGADSDEEWHAFCARCFAGRQGWSSTPKRHAEDADVPAPGSPATSVGRSPT
jgi:hypothetical protein